MRDKLKRAIVPALLVVAAYYAVFGGEYSVFDLRAARASVESAREELAEIHRQTDSLEAWADSLKSDPATLERIAREEYGMIREGETLYRFADADDAIAADTARAPIR